MLTKFLLICAGISSTMAPEFWLNPEVTDFYQFTPDDVKRINYQTGSQIKNIPIAV